MPCSPCWAMKHLHVVMQAIHVVCVIIPSAKAHRQGQQACIVLLELQKCPPFFYAVYSQILFIINYILLPKGITCIKGAMWQGYCCFRSILCWSHYILAFTRTQNANCRVMLKISYKCHQGAQTIIISLMIFAGLLHENLKTFTQLFQVLIHLHPCHCLPLMAGNGFSA